MDPAAVTLTDQSDAPSNSNVSRSSHSSAFCSSLILTSYHHRLAAFFWVRSEESGSFASIASSQRVLESD